MQVLVLMVPVFLGFMGFAIDLGRLYMARNELKTAANAMALAAAQRLNGTRRACGRVLGKGLRSLLPFVHARSRLHAHLQFNS